MMPFNELQLFSLSIIIGVLLGIFGNLFVNAFIDYQENKTPKNFNWIVIYILLLIGIIAIYAEIFFSAGNIPPDQGEKVVIENTTEITFYYNITINENYSYQNGIIPLFNKKPTNYVFKGPTPLINFS